MSTMLMRQCFLLLWLFVDCFSCQAQQTCIFSLQLTFGCLYMHAPGGFGICFCRILQTLISVIFCFASLVGVCFVCWLCTLNCHYVSQLACHNKFSRFSVRLLRLLPPCTPVYLLPRFCVCNS